MPTISQWHEMTADTINDKTGDVESKTTKTKKTNLNINNVNRLRGPGINNHVLYQLKKHGKAEVDQGNGCVLHMEVLGHGN